MTTAYIGIGANLGNRGQTLRRAAAALSKQGIELLAASFVYETAPVGVVDQPDFFNAVLKVHTGLSARAMLDVLLATEQQFGRVRKKKWGPRILDLDVLLYGDEVIREAGLEVPHPHMHTRAFVLVPLCDLNPEGRHPILQQTFLELAQALDAGRTIQRVKGISLLPDFE